MRRRSRVEVFEEIRRDARVDPSLSVRQLARRHGVHRRAVRQALASPVPPPRKEYPNRSRPAIDPWVEVIDGWLIGDKAVHRKQAILPDGCGSAWSPSTALACRR